MTSDIFENLVKFATSLLMQGMTDPVTVTLSKHDFRRLENYLWRTGYVRGGEYSDNFCQISLATPMGIFTFRAGDK